VWKANLELRGATRVLARIARFRAMHLAQRDKRARKLAWGEVLRPDVPGTVEASCRRSKIYHAGAAAQRVATAIREALGAPVTDDAAVRVLARIEDDLVTISIDTTGESLHKRGHKEAVARAPMRETMAAMFLRQCGFEGREPVLDPMCGSGTFVIEAAEIALGLLPGRTRSFAFEQLRTFDAAAWAAMKAAGKARPVDLRFSGSDRDAGAIRMAGENAERAGVAMLTRFEQRPVEELERPEGAPGLVIVNPPYGARIGHKGPLLLLHRQLGDALRAKFSGWRVGIITADAGLARATGLPFGKPGAPVLHGGIRVTLWQTGPLP
jgi:putative N6-adenine-specific DNA methylase